MTYTQQLQILLSTFGVNSPADLPPEAAREGHWLAAQINAASDAVNAVRRTNALRGLQRGLATRQARAAARTLRIAAAFRAGKSVAQIGRAESTSRSRVYDHLHQAGLYPDGHCPTCRQPLVNPDAVR